MIPVEIAEFVQARSVGAGRWMARYHVRDDRSHSISIGTGRDRQTLVHCHRGCTLHQVLTASGLRLQDLFPRGPRLRENTFSVRSWRGCPILLQAMKP